MVEETALARGIILPKGPNVHLPDEQILGELEEGQCVAIAFVVLRDRDGNVRALMPRSEWETSLQGRLVRAREAEAAARAALTDAEQRLRDKGDELETTRARLEVTLTATTSQAHAEAAPVRDVKPAAPPAKEERSEAAATGAYRPESRGKYNPGADDTFVPIPAAPTLAEINELIERGVSPIDGAQKRPGQSVRMYLARKFKVDMHGLIDGSLSVPAVREEWGVLLPSTT